MSREEKKPIPVITQTEFGVIGPMGLAINTVQIRKIQAEIDRNQAEREKDKQKPPKPPRRPNAGIGRLALGHGF